MSAQDYLEGVPFFLGTWGAALAAAALIVRKRLPWLDRQTSLAAFALVATLCVIAVHLVPGMLYVLARETVLLAALLLLLVAWRLPSAQGPAESPLPPPAVRSRRGERTVALAGCLAFAIWLVAVLVRDRYSPPDGIDTLSFHLPNVARWIDTGTIWQIDEFLPELFFGNYPNNGDVVLLATLLPWKNDFLTHYFGFVYVPVVAFAVYVLCCELRSPRAVAVLLGLVVAAIPIVVEPAVLQAMPDVIMYLGFTTGLTFLIRHRRTGLTSDLVLGGLGIGLALGTKWYGVPATVVVVAVWIGARVLARTSPRLLLRDAALLCGVIALAGGVWMLRNWILSGNPVFPLKVEFLGATILDAPKDVFRDIVGFTLADYLDQPSVWTDYLADQFRRAAALPAAILVAGALAAGISLIFQKDLRARRGLEVRAPVLGGLAVFALLVVAYFVTPYSALGPEDEPTTAGANVRYVVPALIVAAPLAGWVAGRMSHRLRLALAVACFVALVDGLAINIVDAKTIAFVAAGVGAGLAIAWTLLGSRLDGVRLHVRNRSWSRPGRWVIAISAAVALTVGVAAGHEVQKRFNESRYRHNDPVLDWVIERAPSGTKIALAGVWSDRGLSPVYPIHGPRLDNEVVYNGPLIDELVRRYAEQAPFVQALKRGDYDLLLVGRAPPRELVARGNTALVQPEVREERWARAAGFSEVERSERFVLFGQRRARG